MSRRRSVALCAAAVAIALTLAQDLEPGLAFYHTWQYALILALAIAVAVPYFSAALRGRDGALGRALALAIGGAAITGIAGLAAGLLGPDTATVDGTPGTVVPIPSLGAAAFFAGADAASIAHGDASITLRRRGAAEIGVAPGSRRMLGESMVWLEPQRAAYVDAYGAHGGHLTLTQPAAPGFLSPVLLFTEHQMIGAHEIPLDTFATPAEHRVFRALALTPAELAEFRKQPPSADGALSIVVTAADDAGRSLGIVMADRGGLTAIGGVHLRMTAGSYPQLVIAAVPPLWALVAGCALFVLGIVLAARAGRSALTAAEAAPAN